jgi:outer membrane protein assembly factor BamB
MVPIGFHGRGQFGRCALVLGLSLGLAAASLTGPASAGPSDTRISLKPNFGPPTSKVKVKGSGFSPSEIVNLAFDSTMLGSITTDSSGAFSTKIKVPASALPGDHTVTATGQSSGRSAMQTFLVRTDWPHWMFDQRRTGANPYENVLNPSNVSGLVTDWTHTGAGAVEWSSPAVVHGTLYVGDDDDNVYALNAATGAGVWTFTTGAPVHSSPAVVNGVVYVGSRDGNVYALKAATGAKVWTFTTGAPIDISSPILVHRVVYIGSHDGNVYALNASTGTPIWSYNTGAPVDSSPAVAHGVVYVTSDNGNVYALNASTGAALWTVVVMPGGGVVYGPAVASGVVYVGTQNGNLYALASNDGATLWKDALGTAGGVQSPAVVNGIVYVGNYYVNALDASTGAILWQFMDIIGGFFAASPVVANGVLYEASEGGYVYALDASNGANLWDATPSGYPFNSSPVVANGVLYEATYNGSPNTIFAFALP